MTRLGVCAALCLLPAIGAAQAQSVESFYKDRTIEIYVGTDPGQALDAYPRLLANYLPKYIPGSPAFVVKNLPGAGGMKATNFIVNVAPGDGTVYGFVTRGLVYGPLLGIAQAQYDPRRFNWIGSTAKETSVLAVWSASTNVKTIQDAMTEEVIVGSNGITTNAGTFPRVMNEFLGTKFRVVHGYKSTSDVVLAMERGEVHGRGAWSWGSLKSGRTSDWVKTGKVRVLVQMAVEKEGELGDVPLALDLAKTTEGRQIMEFFFAPVTIGWPSFMAPGVPAERIAALRAAYDKALRDPALIADAVKQNLELDPLTGAQIDKIVQTLYAMPESVIARARALMAVEEK